MEKLSPLFNIANYIKGHKIEILFLISLISISFGIFIIIIKNPIYSVLFLIGLFGSISLYLIFIGLEFIGLSYLLVYVGAISILFLFILMLINIRVSELITEGKNSVLLALLTILIFNSSVNQIIPYNISMYNINIKNAPYLENFTSKLSDVTNTIVEYIYSITVYINIVLWEIILIEISHISSIGNILYSDLSIQFIITSLILLLGMVGAIIITKKIYSEVKKVSLVSSMLLSNNVRNFSANFSL